MYKVMNYLKEVFPDNCVEQEDSEIFLSLPKTISRRYKFLEGSIMDISCIFISYRYTEDERLEIENLKKHLRIIEQKTNREPIFVFNQILTRQRHELMKNKISYIVPEKQIYLPFLFFIFRDKTIDLIDPVPQLNTFTASAQHVLIYSLYDYITSTEEEIFPMKIAEKLALSKMSVNRALNHFVELGFVEKTGLTRSTRFNFTKQPFEIFKQCKELWINPIKSSVYVDSLESSLKANLLKAGEFALSEFSLLNYFRKQYATDSQNFKEFKKVIKFEEDYANNIEIQFWHYNPFILSEITNSEGKVDPISLYLTLRDSNDERLSGELKYVLSKFFNQNITLDEF